MNTTQCECALCEREHQSRLVVLESIVKCLLDLCKHNTNAHTRAHIAQHVKCVPSLFQNCVNAPTITTTVSLCSTRECAHRLIYMQFFSAHVLRTRERLNEVIHQFNAHKHRYFVRGVHVFFFLYTHKCTAPTTLMCLQHNCIMDWAYSNGMYVRLCALVCEFTQHSCSINQYRMCGEQMSGRTYALL